MSLIISILLVSQTMFYAAVTMTKISYVFPFCYVGIIASIFVDKFYFNENIDFFQIVGILLTSLGLISQLIIEK